MVAARRLRIRRGPVCFALGLAAWVALLESGVEPIVIGLALGLLAYAYPAPRDPGARDRAVSGVPRAADCGDRPARGRRAPLGDVHQRAAPAALPSLDELRRRAAVRPRQRRRLDRSSLSRACGHIADRARRLRRLRRRQAPGDLRRVMAADAGEPCRLGRPSGGPRSPARARSQASDSPWRCSSRRWPSTGRSSRRRSSGSSARPAAPPWSRGCSSARPRCSRGGCRTPALLGTAQPLVDLYIDVDPERDHIRGPVDAPVTVVEYGDFECPYCGMAEPVVRELLSDFADVRYVWRNLPLNDVHGHAQLAAEAAEAAADQGAFWEMHDLLFAHQDALEPADLVVYAAQLGLDDDRFADALREHAGGGQGRGRRRQRRPERRHRNADVLRQRPPSPRRLRHWHVVRRRARRRRPGFRRRNEGLTTGPGVARFTAKGEPFLLDRSVMKNWLTWAENGRPGVGSPEERSVPRAAAATGSASACARTPWYHGSERCCRRGPAASTRCRRHRSFLVDYSNYLWVARDEWVVHE